jgi:hypothetical protein
MNEPLYIFDIDGTLAIMKNRDPYDWANVKNDALNLSVFRCLQALRQSGCKIAIFTGRDGCCEDLTKEWLSEYGVGYDYFAIRPTGDKRPDDIVKLEMFEEMQAKHKFYVLGVFDDRDKVVKMWRERGLQCFQVDYGDF